MIEPVMSKWLIWRLEDAVERRREDHRAVASGGAGYGEGYRAGVESALRDCLDMLKSLEGSDERA